MNIPIKFVCSVFFIFPALLDAQILPTVGEHELARGVVVDRQRSQVYLMDPGGGVIALSVSNGSRVWLNDTGSRPIGFATDGTLAVQQITQKKNQLQIAWLHPVDGQIAQQVTMELPPNINTAVKSGLGRSFDIVSVTRGNVTSLRWEFQKSTITAVQNFASENSIADSDAIRLNGEVQNLLHTSAAIAKSSKMVLASNEPLRPSRDWEEEWLTGESGRQFISLSGDFVLVSQRTTMIRQDQPKYRWRLLSRDGQFLGETTSDYSFRPFAVIDEVLLVVLPVRGSVSNGRLNGFPPTLVATRLRSAEQIWQQTIRDIEYRGPYPY